MSNFISGIYCIVNLVNNKRYIGQAVNLERRKYEHFFAKKRTNPILKRAINKYGLENFEFIVLEYTKDDKDDLTKAEQKYLDYYLENNKWDRLYNLCPKAETILGLKATDEAKRNISKALTGKAKSFQHVEKIRQRMKIRGMTEGATEKSRLKTIIPVLQYDILTGNLLYEFDSLISAAKYNNIKGTTRISRNAKGKIPSAHGFIWKFKNQEDVNKNDDVSNKISQIMKGIPKKHTEATIAAAVARQKSIDMCDSNTQEFIMNFSSIKDAYIYLNLNGGNISRVLNGEYRKAHGYFWKYTE